MLCCQGETRQKMRLLQESYLFLFKILDGRIHFCRLHTQISASGSETADVWAPCLAVSVKTSSRNGMRQKPFAHKMGVRSEDL